MLKLIATDLDGTVLGPDFRFRPRTLEAFRAAREAGVQIVFVTGRPHRWLTPLREQVEYDSVAICSNGAVVYDVAAQRPLEAFPIPRQVLPPLIARLRARFPRAVFAAETLGQILVDESWPGTNLQEMGQIARGPLEGLLEEGAEESVVKFLIRDDSASPRELLSAVAAEAGGEVSVTHAVAQMPLIEMGQHGLSKGRTLQAWCAEQGIAAEEVAVGPRPRRRRGATPIRLGHVPTLDGRFRGICRLAHPCASTHLHLGAPS